MSTELAHARTELSTHSAEAFFNAKQLQLLSDAIMKGATPDEISFFGEVCKRTGLDPFRKQIHAVKRWDSKERREVWSYQTGIDGLRAIAHRSKKCAGIDDAVFIPADESAEFPVKASVTVWKIVNGERVPFTASARWTEYVQTTKEGKVTSMWLKLPYSQLAKCAEALALRKAFPECLGGLHSDEEMGQVDNPDPAPRSVYELPEAASAPEAPVPTTAPVPAAAAPKTVNAEVIPPSPVTTIRPKLEVPEDIAAFVGGAWKGVELADGRKLGKISIVALKNQRQHLPEGLRLPLLASYIDQILATIAKNGGDEESFADYASEQNPDVGFPGELWRDPVLYPSLLKLAEEWQP